MDQSQTIDNANLNADEHLNADESQTAVKSLKISSNNPFDDNYRHQLDMDNPRDRKIAEDNGFTPELVNYYRSAEYAEFTRPMDQLMWLLNERGLKEKYGNVLISDPDHHDLSGEEIVPLRYERLSKFMKEEAPDLVKRFEKVWEIMKSRGETVKRGERLTPNMPEPSI